METLETVKVSVGYPPTAHSSLSVYKRLLSADTRARVYSCCVDGGGLSCWFFVGLSTFFMCISFANFLFFIPFTFVYLHCQSQATWTRYTDRMSGKMARGIEIKRALAGYTRISYNGEEIAKHYLSATTQGTREAFDIPEEESVISWLENHFSEEINAIENENS